MAKKAELLFQKASFRWVIVVARSEATRPLSTLHNFWILQLLKSIGFTFRVQGLKIAQKCAKSVGFAVF